ncbi:MAG: PEP-CTERM sorting domain-containing protein, partial [Candidatus Tectomicrobia bacterium]|nr:PEP-CTERM sorting domain-containing protein [Candidatus Tectomicrobia bacterium]
KLRTSLINTPPDNGGGGGDPVPEPGTILLLGSGLAALALVGRKKWQVKK